MINPKLGLLLIVGGLFSVMVLSGLPVSRVGATSGTEPQGLSGSVSGARREVLERLYNQLRSGAQFSEEERLILERFSSGYPITDLEADVVISRALYQHYIANSKLTKEQELLLSRYTQFVARRDHDIADRKTELLKRRIASSSAAPPRNTPLAPPANDLCAGAEVIPGAGPFPHLTAITDDITDATGTGDPAAPSCQTNVSRTIWYRFTPSVTAEYTLSSCADGPTATTVEDTVMAIYTSTGGCAGPFSAVPTGGASDGCDDDSCASEAFQAAITTQLTAGTQYFIVVSQFGSAPPLAGKTAVQLLVTQVLGPANDICASARPLPLNSPVIGTTIAAGADYTLSGTTCFTGTGNASATAAGRDVVYSFTAPLAGVYSFKVTDYDAVSNLVLYVSTSCPVPGALTCNNSSGPVIAAANRDSTSTSEQVKCIPLGAGQQIFVFVDENILTDGSRFTLEATLCAPETEPNDTPALANTSVFGIEGSITPVGDADFYSLGSPASGSRVFALVDGVAANSSGDFDLRVTTTTDTLEYDDFNNDPLFGILAPNVAGTIATGTQTFVRVNHFTTNPVPPGPPPTPAAAEPYRLYAVVQPPINTATSEVEPNDTIGQANSSANNYFVGTLTAPAPSEDLDTFSFSAQAGRLVFISLDCDPLRDNTPVNASLTLLDAKGAVLVSVNDPDSTSSNTPSPGTLIGVSPKSPSEGLVYNITATGTYYVQVTIGTTLPDGTGQGDYLLSIALSPADCLASIDAMTSSINPAGGTGSVAVDIAGGCGWNAVSNVPWITISSGEIGVGDGTVNYSVSPNNSAAARTGTLTIASQTFTLTQVGIHVSADFDSDLRSELGFYRNGTWGFLQSSQNYDFCCGLFFSWGGAGLPPFVADFDGDGKGDLAFMVPPSGGQSQAYAILRSTTNYDVTKPLFVPAGFPALGDTPVVGDFDGDGEADPGIWRSTEGVWIIPKSSTDYSAFLFSQWGVAGDTPIVADIDGDGRADFGFYRDGLWGFLQSSLNYDFCCGRFFSWGGPGLQPVVADFDGDGIADIAHIVLPSGGQSAAYAILKSSANYDFNQALFVPAGFPVLGDTPVVGDFDGDRKDDPGIWRSSEGVWIIPRSTTNYTTFIFSQWGQAGDVPFPSSLTQR